MRRARIRTTHATPAAASVVADALTPDNTASMTTRVDGLTVETTIERDTTGGLHSSVDDYVVNLTVADRVIDGETAETGAETSDTATTADTVTRTSDAPADEQPADHTTDTETTDDTHE